MGINETVCIQSMLGTVLHVIRVYRRPAGARVLHLNRGARFKSVQRDCSILYVFAVSDREESCEEMSVPSSPQNEAIQHSSVSTSNGISSSASAASSAAPSNHSTEDGQQGATQTQPSGS